MKNILFGILGLSLLLLAGFLLQDTVREPATQLAVNSHPGPDAPKDGGYDTPNGRAEWNHQRLANPVTGEIPAGMRSRELAFASKLPTDAALSKNAAFEPFDWQQLGPWNVGGRSRALALDVTNNDIVFAGGVSGGLWRSENFGEDWEKVTGPNQHQSITCITQDTRAGKTDTWYYGSGEVSGNSASRSFSAQYLGSGVYKSTDGGDTWVQLSATASGTPQQQDSWDEIWGMATDPSVTDKDVVYAAVQGAIMRSEDGGDSWTQVLGTVGFDAPSTYTEILVTEGGSHYATFSKDGSVRGIFRSDDGINWTSIRPTGWPAVYERIVMAQVPGEDIVYFLAETNNAGQEANPTDNESEWHSLWKYEYVSGTGADAGGIWTDLSSNLPQANENNATFRSQGSYDMCMTIKPDDPDVIWIGGTNLFRSTDGFTSQNNTTQMGGYLPGGSGPWGYRWTGHHPDQHGIVFRTDDPDRMINANDGGLYRANNANLNSIPWENISLGLITSQFYSVAIDHGTPGSEVVMGGLQDNGTQWTNSRDVESMWVSPNLGDGSHCAVADGGQIYYNSRQYGRILKMSIDGNGTRTAYERVDPTGSGDFLFVHPFILDPADNNVMYLPEGDRIWRNTDLNGIALNNGYNKISQGWQEMTQWEGGGNDVTMLAASVANPPNRLYFGMNNGRIYRVDNANTTSDAAVEVTNNIAFAGYTSAIAVDPTDGDKALVCYSNYEVVSIYYTSNGGDSWTNVGGNLEDPQVQGAPTGIVEGDGPSFRSARIVPVENGTVFLAGTSTGLYATSKMDGENTVWVQQGADVIGNVVVEAIDARTSDGFVAVATHGNGVYAANVDNIWRITGQEELVMEADVAAELFPNPAKESAALTVHLKQSERISVDLLTLSGQVVQHVFSGQANAGSKRFELSLEELPAGLYLVRTQAGDAVEVQKLLKQ